MGAFLPVKTVFALADRWYYCSEKKAESQIYLPLRAGQYIIIFIRKTVEVYVWKPM